ncbi:MAG: nucleoside 2-deoxyribosyltransferase [gamma proteobacterium symbiont of Ctena orbiculata]
MSLSDFQNRSSPTVYLAAPLFSEAEIEFNYKLTALLEDFTSVYLPQRDGGLMSKLVDTGIPPNMAAHRIFNLDMKAIESAQYVIAILDGRAIDEGVAFELGIAFSQSKRCIGLQTDSRRLAKWGNNPMITGALDVVFTSSGDMINWLKSLIYTEQQTHTTTI